MKNKDCAVIDEDVYIYPDEGDFVLYKCSKCFKGYIQREYRFCPMCGIKIKWKRLTDKERDAQLKKEQWTAQHTPEMLEREKMFIPASPLPDQI